MDQINRRAFLNAAAVTAAAAPAMGLAPGVAAEPSGLARLWFEYERLTKLYGDLYEAADESEFGCREHFPKPPEEIGVWYRPARGGNMILRPAIPDEINAAYDRMESIHGKSALLAEKRAEQLRLVAAHQAECDKIREAAGVTQARAKAAEAGKAQQAAYHAFMAAPALTLDDLVVKLRAALFFSQEYEFGKLDANACQTTRLVYSAFHDVQRMGGGPMVSRFDHDDS